MRVHELPHGRIHEGDWLQADLAPGYTLAIVDGPYGMGKAAWDRVKIDQLADWYAPHIERLSGLMADSATVYLWNTAEGWARLDPVMRAAGWRFQIVIVWDKVRSYAQCQYKRLRSFPQVTEFCGVYTRGDHFFDAGYAFTNNWRMGWQEWADERLLSGRMRHWVRMQGPRNEPLHDCQKPLAFAERMIRASSRPGDRILAPFGGTSREAVVCEWLARTDPKEARRYDVCELNQDGPDYIGAALVQIRGDDPRRVDPRQVRLFGGAP